jgi:hypothetical protein
MAAAVIAMTVVGCTKSGGSGPAGEAATPSTQAPPPSTQAPPELPSTLTDVNVAAGDMGGGIELLTGNYDPAQPNYGPGLTGRRLIDGLTEPTWITPADWSPNRMYNKAWGWADFPADIELSFFERQPALIGAVTVVVPEVMSLSLQGDTSAAPKEVEVWTSMDDVPGHFAKATAATLETTPGEHTVTFPAREARFVKLRVLSGASQRVLEIAEVRVLEAARAGYMPLFTRRPEAQRWKGSPRDAAQRGLEWLQQSAADWQRGGQGCIGCHVQAQALMGQEVALEKGYRVSMPAVDVLAERIRTHQTAEGIFQGGAELATTVFGAMGLARADAVTGKNSDPSVIKAVDYLLKSQAADGAIPEPSREPPILQGQFMMTSNALVAMKWAAAHSQDPRYGQAAERAIAWIASNEPETTQDKVFKSVALMHYGTPEHKRIAWSVVEALVAAQQPDGGWKEVAATDGSNAFATGQVLYAFKQAGVSISAPVFKRGVDFLLRGQVNEPTPANGSWKAEHTQSQRKSDFGPTMWAVIGLAGSYGTEPKGALQVSKEGGRSAGRNLEIVLDVSGSMNTKLGASTRWQTALDVLKEVVAALPDDLDVGLRAYGHRYSSKSAQTCQDTELIVPIGKLDRQRLMDAASGLHPRGETPLIRSALQTLIDLKAAGGGTVVLITDGEESCHGSARDAAAKIKASGLDVRLNIVGFTLTGKVVEAQLGALAGSTGGRYYGAQDGAQLARAVKFAALQRLPYDVLDAGGHVVASGETSALSRELPAGNYQVRINVLGQVLEEPVKIAGDQTTSLTVGMDGDKTVLRPEIGGSGTP